MCGASVKGLLEKAVDHRNGWQWQEKNCKPLQLKKKRMILRPRLCCTRKDMHSGRRKVHSQWPAILMAMNKLPRA